MESFELEVIPHRVQKSETMARRPVGALLTNLIFPSNNRTTWYKGFILVLTFFAYTSYHLSRKPIGIVKGVLHHKNCTQIIGQSLGDNVGGDDDDAGTCWVPFDNDDTYEQLLGALDYAYLFAYALGMYISGHIAERMDLRYFLTLGMLLSGLFTVAMGFAYFLQIHTYSYFLSIQIVGGLFQASGWPSVVAVVANWFGKGRRGLIMGIWNSHTSVGNILGSIIAGVFVDNAWGWSFVVPGLIISAMGMLVFFFLIVYPSDVGCDPPVQNKGDDAEHSDLSDQPAISFLSALFIPGVIEFSMCLFFAKLVSYSFLFWLPFYILHNLPGVNDTQAAYLSTVFDVGGIFGGILAGYLADVSGSSGIISFIYLIVSAPLVFIYNFFGRSSYVVNIVLMGITGFFVNGPYALITTAVSADLGTHPSLHGNAKALSTVTAIIDGTGTIGSALGPLLTGLIAPHNTLTWTYVFLMLSGAEIIGALLLLRQIFKEIRAWRSSNAPAYHPINDSESERPLLP